MALLRRCRRDNLRKMNCTSTSTTSTNTNDPTNAIVIITMHISTIANSTNKIGICSTSRTRNDDVIRIHSIRRASRTSAPQTRNSGLALSLQVPHRTATATAAADAIAAVSSIVDKEPRGEAVQGSLTLGHDGG